MDKIIYLSVIIPAYNEEELIQDTLLEVNDFLCKQKYNYEIIVVDDGSKDNTFFVSEDLKKEVKFLSTVKNNKNCGKGYSVRKGMLLAKGKRRLFMDADSSTSINQVNNFMPFLDNNYDLAIGDRRLKNSKITKRQAFYKETLGNIGNILIKTLIISDINDTQCGFKLFSGEFVEKFFPKLKINRWGFDIEILAVADKFGYKIKTVPIVWKNREKSNVHLKDYFFTLLELFKIKINIIRKIYESK